MSRGSSLSRMLSLDDIRAADSRIRSQVHRTPTLASSTLAAAAGCNLRLKAELFQKTGSFKVRGVLNRLMTLPADALRQGLVTLSAGNHGAALAWAARAAHTRATVVMPAHAVPSKVAAVRAYGGEPVLTDGNLLARTQALQREQGLTLVHPFDDPMIIAGHGTLGVEVLEDLPEAHVVVVPVGGGGLISGVAVAVKALRPHCQVIGVEPVGADVMSRSLAAGEPASMERPRSVADGLAAPFAGALTFTHVRALVDRVVLVEDSAILAATRLIVERMKLMVEPAGAASLAALLSGALPVQPDQCVVCVLSGGNMDPGVLQSLL